VSAEQVGAEKFASEEVLQNPIEFTGEFEKDYRIAREWFKRLRDVRLDIPSSDADKFDEEALRHLEKQPWRYRFTTSEGSRYFASPSGVVIRVKRETPPWGGRVQRPTRLLGFIPEELTADFGEFVTKAQQGRTCNNGLVLTVVEGDANDGFAPTTVTIRNLSSQPQIGLRPLDTAPRDRIEKIEFDREHGKVSFTYSWRCAPIAHMGNAITQIES
jgi:hypothetical protein